MPPSNEDALFALALEKPAAKRAAWLDAECDGDSALRQRLDALLAAHEQPDMQLDAPRKADLRRDELHESPSRRQGQGLTELGPPIDKTVGQTLGRYKLLEHVGGGGCGVVYVAEQTEPVRRLVALKVIKLGMDTKQVVARFVAERQALSMMDHPNIAKVLDAGMTESDSDPRSRGRESAQTSSSESQRRLTSAATIGVGRPYFVMELVRGIRITDYCDQAQLSTKERLNLLICSLVVLLYQLLAGSTPFDGKELMAPDIDAMRRTIREKEPVRPSTKLTQALVAADVSPQSHHLAGDSNAGGCQRRLTSAVKIEGADCASEGRPRLDRDQEKRTGAVDQKRPAPAESRQPAPSSRPPDSPTLFWTPGTPRRLDTVMKPPPPIAWLLLSVASAVCTGQEYGKPDRGNPGDAMIQEYLDAEAQKLETDFLAGIKSREDWGRERPRLEREYLYMLGLSPLPEKTPLRATVTRTLDRGDYLVDMVHYQSRPGLYVTANLYRPAKVKAAEKFPALLYVCGHSGRGRNGNKTAFQSHGIWFARHGFVCLVVDTLQLGEIAGIHHGTYREGRWWWLSRGYTPAGVECWNGVRGIDYLLSRPDVDPDRIGVTGISGGGAATFWVASADDRVKVAVPVSGMADLMSYVPNRVINGHCDCMFLYNAYNWHWTTIAGLIAPRPMLFVNSDADAIFPMDANERVINRLERLYSLFGAGDRVDSFVSIGGHAYRQDIRQGVCRFLNTHLRGDPRLVMNTEVDLLTGPREENHPIAPEDLRVFPKDEDIPKDALNGRIDQSFVEIGRPPVPSREGFAAWKDDLVKKLREVTFHHFPERIPAATAERVEGDVTWLKTEGNIRVPLRKPAKQPENPEWMVLEVVDSPRPSEGAALVILAPPKGAAAFNLEPRGIGATRWTQSSPPNYVERSHYLLGRTVDSGRVWDIIATARYLQAQYPQKKLRVVGAGRAGVLVVFAALLEEDIRGIELGPMQNSLMNEGAPALLNALRVCDVPEAIALAARDVIQVGPGYALPAKTLEILKSGGARTVLP